MNNNYLYQQKGMVSLIVAVLSLVLASSVVIYVNRNAISEILSQQAQQQTRYARDAADAGLAYTSAIISANTSTYINADGSLTTVGQQPIAISIPSMTISGKAVDLKQKFIVNLARTNITGPIILTSIGGYDCSSNSNLANNCKSSSTSTLLINLPTGTGFGPTDAMITLGAATFSGSSCIEGGENGNAVHSGGTTNYAKNYSGDGCTDNNGKGAYGDTFQKDGNLASMEGAGVETLQKELYGKTGAELCAGKDASALASNGSIDIGSLSAGGIYCFTGSFKITGNGTAGSATNPALIYINGNVDVAGTPIINGILHSTGSTNLTGNITVNGSVISNGAITQSSGNLKVIYKDYSNELGNPSDGKFRAIAGSWKDW